MIIKLLTTLFTKVLGKQVIRNSWKLSDFIFMYKKGVKHKDYNYRPIIQTPIISTIFSKLLDM